MTGIGNYKFYVPDTETQQVAFFGTVQTPAVPRRRDPPNRPSWVWCCA